MRRLLTALSALLLAVVVLPALVADDKDKDKKDPAPDVKKDADPDKKDPAPDVKKDADKDKKDPAPDVTKDADKDKKDPAPDVKKDADKDKKDPAPDVKKDAEKDKKDPPPDAKKDADKDKKDEPVVEKPIKVGTVSGKLAEVNETAKSIKVEVTTEVAKPNVGEIQALQSCKVQLAQAYAQRNFSAIPGIEQQMAQHSLHTTTMEKKTATVDYTSTDDVKIRLLEPPPAFDDKGNIKKRTKKELDELKGDPKDPDFKLPGYPGAFTDLHQGAMVAVTLVKKKGVPHHTGPKPKDADPDLAQDNLPQASLIEIYPDPPGAK